MTPLRYRGSMDNWSSVHDRRSMHDRGSMHNRRDVTRQRSVRRPLVPAPSDGRLEQGLRRDRFRERRVRSPPLTVSRRQNRSGGDRDLGGGERGVGHGAALRGGRGVDRLVGVVGGLEAEGGRGEGGEEGCLKRGVWFNGLGGVLGAGANQVYRNVVIELRFSSNSSSD